MQKSDWTLPAIIIEIVTVITTLVYIGLQIFYGLYYHIPTWQYLTNVIAALMIYGILTLLQLLPHHINHLPREICTGNIRKFCLRMTRIIKLLFLGSLLIPCVADALGRELRGPYSAVAMLLIIVVWVYYEFRIVEELKNNQ